MEGELQQTAIAFIDNNILVIYFDNSTESEIEINTDETEKTFKHRYINNNKTKKSVVTLSIILPLALVSASINNYFFCSSGKRKKKCRTKE